MTESVESMGIQAASELLNYGLTGILTLLLCVAIVWLMREHKEERKNLIGVIEKIDQKHLDENKSQYERLLQLIQSTNAALHDLESILQKIDLKISKS